MAECDCEKAIHQLKGAGWLLSGWRQDGETVTCPDCRTLWVHECDEAEGCAWLRVIAATKEVIANG